MVWVLQQNKMSTYHISSITKQKSREDESRTLIQSHTKETIQSIPIIPIEKRNKSTHTCTHTCTFKDNHTLLVHIQYNTIPHKTTDIKRET